MLQSALLLVGVQTRSGWGGDLPGRHSGFLGVGHVLLDDALAPLLVQPDPWRERALVLGVVEALAALVRAVFAPLLGVSCVLLGASVGAALPGPGASPSRRRSQGDVKPVHAGHGGQGEQPVLVELGMLGQGAEGRL